jgi:hypothetical protein
MLEGLTMYLAEDQVSRLTATGFAGEAIDCA